MIDFTQQFTQAHSFELEYNGKKISRFLKVNKKGSYILRFTFVSTNSRFTQAIVLFFSEDFKGKVYLMGKEQKIPKTPFPKMNFWEDTAPRSFDVEVDVEAGQITVCNGSDPLGTKQICHSLSFGCALINEKLGEDRFRFQCNDHENDDDFDDLIFEMEIIKSTSK